ncbi:MAG: outer membrane lipoprotein chaperone LolA [Pseudomonadota bacterium]
MGVRVSLIAAAFGCVFLVDASARAADDGEDRGRELLQRFMSDVASFTATFEQALLDANNVELESSSGSVQVRRPGQFRWTYEEPYVQILVADGLNVWSYDVDLEQVTVKPQFDVLANTPALLLSGSRDVDDEFEYLESYEDRGVTWVRLEPKNSDNGFVQVALGFRGEALEQMLFFDTLDQTTRIELTDVALNADIENSVFAFVLPPDADLIGEPLKAERLVNP